MSNLVSLTQAQAPASSQQKLAAGTSLAGNFSDGIRDAFPLLSIKGSRFHLRMSGQSQAVLDPATNTPVSFLDVILVNASRLLSKTYYIKGFAEGDLNPPDCWSLDAIRPDPSVVNKVNPTCPNCPMNAFGSRITPDGKAAKACQDARRVAVMMPHQLGHPDPMVLMLRIPQSSLKNLKNHVQLLERHGFMANACVTRLSFDPTAAYPKLLFNFARPLTDPQYKEVEGLAESDQVAAMLAAPDFDNAATPAPAQTGQMHGFAPQEAPLIVPDTAPQAQPEQAAAVIVPEAEEVTSPASAAAPHEVPSTVIELPDGQMFDTATGEYVERAQPAVQMPELDPDTIKLPEGTYFHRVRREYVTGPEKGAPIATPPQPATRERKARAKPKVEAKEEAPKIEPAKVEEPPVQEAKPANGMDDSDDVKPVVTAAVPELDDILKGFKRPTPQ